jgi:hypothetical protein
MSANARGVRHFTFTIRALEQQSEGGNLPIDGSRPHSNNLSATVNRCSEAATTKLVREPATQASDVKKGLRVDPT